MNDFFGNDCFRGEGIWRREVEEFDAEVRGDFDDFLGERCDFDEDRIGGIESEREREESRRKHNKCCCEEQTSPWFDCRPSYPPRLHCPCNCNPIPKRCGCVPVPGRGDDGKTLKVENGEYVLVRHCDNSRRCCEEGVALPMDEGFKAWSLRLEDTSTGVTLPNGTLYAVKLYIRNPLRVDQIAFNVLTAATGAVAGQNHVGLYTHTGTLIAQSGDISALYTTTGFHNASIPRTVLRPGEYWVVFLSNAATPPTLLASAVPAAIINAGLTGAALRAGTTGTGLTSLPASFNPAALVAAQVLWVALR